MAITEVNLRQESASTAWEIEAFYDGACPLCMREVSFLRRIDRHGKIRFTNIAAADFCADDYGIELNEFMTEIHGRLPNGTWVRGVEVFRRLYSAAGCGLVVWGTRLPLIRGLLDRAYSIFARNRLRWTGRCPSNTTCQYEPSKSNSEESCKRDPTEFNPETPTKKLGN